MCNYSSPFYTFRFLTEIILRRFTDRGGYDPAYGQPSCYDLDGFLTALVALVIPVLVYLSKTSSWAVDQLFLPCFNSMVQPTLLRSEVFVTLWDSTRLRFRVHISGASFCTSKGLSQKTCPSMNYQAAPTGEITLRSTT